MPPTPPGSLDNHISAGSSQNFAEGAVVAQAPVVAQASLPVVVAQASSLHSSSSAAGRDACATTTAKDACATTDACAARACLLLLFLLALAGPSAWAATNGSLIRGTVLFPAEVALTVSQFNLIAVATADIDGDGIPDVVAASTSPDKIVWYRSNGDGTFASTQYLVTTLPISVPLGSNIAVGDLDGDNRIDVAFWTGEQRIKWCRNVGGTLASGLFGYTAANPTANHILVAGTENYDTYVAIGDVDGDNVPDILSATAYLFTLPAATNNIVAWYRNLGGANFNWNAANPTANRILLPTEVAGSRLVSPSSVRPGDLNGDGLPDIVVTFRNSGKIAWLRNTGTVASPAFSFEVLPGLQTNAQNSGIADLDGDGWPDLICAAPGLPTLHWFRNQTHDAVPVSPFFGAAQGISGAVTASVPVPADLNSDARVDVVTQDANLNKVLWSANFGSGSFSQATISTAVNIPVSVAVADFNQDGVLDVVSASNGTPVLNGRKVAAYINKGGQVALAGLDTAPASLMEGKRDDIVRIAVSNRGLAGDNHAQIATLGLLFEKSAGVPMTSAEANALIDSLHLYVDTDSSGVFELGTDALVASLADLTLTSGQQVFTVSPGTPANAQVAAAATRYFFVVPKIAASASSQTPNTFRITHLATGTGRSTFKDALNPTIALTLESLSLANTASAFVTAIPAHTYDDHTYIYFDGNSAPGTGALDDFDFDGIQNLTEFGFGSHLAVNSTAPMVVTGGVLVLRGQPTVLVTNTETGVIYQALFCRRKDPLAQLTYSVHFSATLLTWAVNTATPVVLADDGVFEAVAVPYPFFVGGKKARFFKVVVSSP